MTQKSNTTVVIPCYNDGRYIEEALDSILRQSLLPEQIIIIDDGSDPATLKVLKKLNDPLLKIVYQENQGVCSARNRGFEMATTEFILTLDADDYFESTFLEKAVTVLHSDSKFAGVCCHYQKHINHKLIDDVIQPLGGRVQDFLVKNNGVGNSLIRKECWEQVGGYDVNFKNGYEDWDFWISILANGWELYVIPEVLFNYRIKKISRDQLAIAQFDIKLRQAIYNKHKELYNRNFESVYFQMIAQNNKLRNTTLNTRQSKDYRLGSFLLKPIRFVKNLIN
jgi:glycosyltransferase involved in cell wall biosynthesis